MSIIFDIESGPLPIDQIERVMPDFEPDSRLKDPVKIAADIAEKREKFIERAALSPTTGEILAIGYCGEFSRIDFQDQGGEAEIIKVFFSEFEKGKNMLGFNCHSFDIPFIIRRAWMHGVTVSRRLLGRYMPDNMIDLMVVWSCGNRDQKISLNSLSKFFGLGEKKGSGEDFAKYYREERAKAVEYLNHDVLLTQLIAQRMGVI